MKRTIRKNPKGGPSVFNCSGCKAQHAVSLYVFAHWDEVIRHDCPKCGAVHTICRGVVEPAPSEAPAAP